MVSRFNRLLFILCIVAIAIYVVIINREVATFSLGGSWFVSANLGVLLITAFCAGLLVTSLIALFFGFKSWMRERKLLSQDKQRQSFIEGMLRARNFAAAGEWNKARDMWQSLSRRDPSDILARLELSRAFEMTGEREEALKVAESVRADHPENIEVLFRAFEIQRDVGNNTAAIDNLALILAKQPSLRAAIEARALSEKLGRISDALEYHEQCLSLGEPSESAAAQGAKLHFKSLLQNSGQRDEETVQRELVNFLKRYPDVVEGHQVLADIERKNGRNGEAAQALINAAKAGAGVSAWNQAAMLWVSDGKPDRALAAARSASQGTTGLTRVEAELFKAQLHLGLSQPDEAARSLEATGEYIKSERLDLPLALRDRYLGLAALAAFRLGKNSSVVDYLSTLSGIEDDSPLKVELNGKRAARHEPSPVYSTP